uniref:Uncharacterized protein n=1 Tax=Opuntia streptacantha TaxID=393608 RepID=A0A7C9AQ58_OPUST
MIIADSDGVGLNILQFTTRMPTSLGRIRVFSNNSSRAPKITKDASSRPSFMVDVFSFDMMDRGTYVSSPIPDESRILLWNSRLSSSNLPDCRASSMNCSLVTLRSSVGLKQAKSRR